MKLFPRELRILFITVIVFGSLTSCTKASIEESTPAYWPTHAWESSLPEEQGLDSEQLVRMFEYIEENDIPLHSLLIVRNGYLVTEAYWQPYGPNDVHTVESITKTIVGSLIGIAIDHGELQSTDQKLVDFFPDRVTQNLDEKKSAISLDNLLSMTPGLDCEDTRARPELDQTGDWVQHFLNLPMSSRPGEKWIYCSGSSHLLSAILQTKTGIETRIYANQYLFAPLGISKVAEQNWASDPQGITNGIAGLYLTPRELAKYGYLYLNKGNWNGTQVIPARWINESTREHAYIGKDEFVSGRDRRFGYLWSLFPEQRYYGYLGRGGQELFVLPDKNMVVVFTGALRVDEEGSLLHLLDEYIVPSIVADSSITVNAEANAKLQALIQNVAGVTQTVPVLPQLALDISNNIYELESNFLGWSDMMFRFEEGSDEALLRMTNSPDLKIGLDGRYRLTESSSTRPVGLRGQWVKPDTLYLDYIIFGDFIRSKASITFADKKITVRINYLNWDNPPILINGNLQK